jgi:hypothetical protein
MGIHLKVFKEIQTAIILLRIDITRSFSSTNKTDRHDIAEILLKVTLSTINQNQTLGK